MTPRQLAIGSALFGMALVFTQDVFAGWAGFHSWQYSAALGLAAIATTSYALGARKGEDGEAGRRIAIALVGALIVIAAGLGSGLLGPDTQNVSRSPGTVASLPDLGVAAFFPSADAERVAAGREHVVLRRKDGSSLDIAPGGRVFFGSSEVELAAVPVAYVEARTASGDHLTITQPTNRAFLSPVLFFGQTVTIAGRAVRADGFATPAVHRQIKAFYYPKGATSGDASSGHGIGANPAVLFLVDDDAGRLQPAGIGFAESGKPIVLAGLRLTATVGTYPTLQIAAVPYPQPLWIGTIIFFAGLAYAAVDGDARVMRRTLQRRKGSIASSVGEAEA